MKVYRVGGCVRDKLMGNTSRDIDWVVVGSTEQEMIEAGFTRVGTSFPVFLHPETHEEYALARTERKTGVGYTGFEVSTENVTLEDDLRRRDFTINSMAEDLLGNLIDPLNGANDIRLGILRHCTNAFREDPLRALRLARFAARLDFTIAPETYFEVINTPRAEFKSISAQRILLELKKAIEDDVLEAFFENLRYLKISWVMNSVICEWQRDMHIPRKMNQDKAIVRMIMTAKMHKESIAKMEELKFHGDCADLAIEWLRIGNATREEFHSTIQKFSKASADKYEITSAMFNKDQQALINKLVKVFQSVSAETVLSSDSSLTGAAIGRAIQEARTQRIESCMIDSMSGI